MTSNDGKKQGIDDDGIDYFITALEHFVEEIPADERVGVFRTGGAQTEEVEFEMNEFIETHLDSRGAQFDSVFDPEYTNAQILFGCAETENLEWRLIYRASKGIIPFHSAYPGPLLTCLDRCSTRGWRYQQRCLHSHEPSKWPNDLLYSVERPPRQCVPVALCDGLKYKY